MLQYITLFKHMYSRILQYITLYKYIYSRILQYIMLYTHIYSRILHLDRASGPSTAPWSSRYNTICHNVFIN